MYLWSPADGARLMALRGHEDWVLALAYAPDGTRIATGSRDGTAKIWDARGGELLWTLAGHAEDVRSVEFSPDGARLVTASGDRSAKIWDPARGELIATLGHRIGLARPDGSIAWPVPPARLIAIACERLAVFTREREALTTYCEPVDAR